MVGAISAIVNWLSRWIMNHWLDFSTAILFAYFFGMFSAYVLNRLFVFKIVNRPLYDQMRDFVLINLAMLPVVLLGAILFSKLMMTIGLNKHVEDIAHALAIGLPVGITFLIYKFYVFRSINASAK